MCTTARLLALVSLFFVSDLTASSRLDGFRVNPLPPTSSKRVTHDQNPRLTPAELRERLASQLRASGVEPRREALVYPDDQGIAKRIGVDVRLVLREGNGTPRHIEGEALEKSSFAPMMSGFDRDMDTVRSFLARNRRLLRLESPLEELQLDRRWSDELGRRHFRFTQRQGNLPVWPAELNVHVDPLGNVDLVNGAYVPTPSRLFPEPALTPENAVARARSATSATGRTHTTAPELIVYAPGDRQPRLAWKMDVETSLDTRWVVIVDAMQGVVLNRYNSVASAAVTGSGIDLAGVNRPLNLWQDGNTFYLIDTSKVMFDPSSRPPALDQTRGGIFIFDVRNQSLSAEPAPPIFHVTSSSSGSWSDPHSVSAAFWLSKTYDYFRDVHGRNSLDGVGGTITAIVRVDRTLKNAFWNGKAMFFGDGDTYAGSADVVGHELSHGVTEKSAGLIYQNQSGALNEAFSDIFGEMVEAESFGSNDWLLGTSLSQPIRSMANPGQFGHPSTMSQFLDTTLDDGGVHINSGIINKAYYQLARGLSGAISRRDAERIFYRALTTHLVKSSQFVDARLAAIRSADELFGNESIQSRKTAEAFDSVEIFEAAKTPDPPEFPEVRGADSTIFIYRDPSLNAFFIGRRETAAGDPDLGVGLFPLPVAISRPAVSGDGSIGVIVTQDRDLCLFETSGASAPECLGLTGKISSVAMSPDTSRFGFVFLDSRGAPDNTIAVIDLATNSSATFPLEAPAADGPSVATILAAGSMDFTADGSFLVYDALNILTLGDGTRVGAWSIYALEIDNGFVFPLIPPVPGYDIAYPGLSQTSDNFMAFDVARASGENIVAAANLSTGDIFTVATITGIFGVPGYTGDDSAIVFNAPSNNPTGANLVRQPMREDRVTRTGSATLWLGGAAFSTIYRRGAFGGPTTQPGAIVFASPEFNATEGSVATITVSRSGGNKGTVSVRYATASSSATAGSDYVETSGTLTWADGDMENKSFQVRVNSDSANEGEESVNLALSSPGGGASLGSQKTSRLMISNREAPPPPARRRPIRRG